MGKPFSPWSFLPHSSGVALLRLITQPSWQSHIPHGRSFGFQDAREKIFWPSMGSQRESPFFKSQKKVFYFCANCPSLITSKSRFCPPFLKISYWIPPHLFWQGYAICTPYFPNKKQVKQKKRRKSHEIHGFYGVNNFLKYFMGIEKSAINSYNYKKRSTYDMIVMMWWW